MNIAIQNEPKIRSVSVTNETIVAHLADGRVVKVPIKWSWRLSNATRRQREHYRIIGDGEGVHWPDVDEDISVEGMLRGSPAKQPSLVGMRIEPVSTNFKYWSSLETLSGNLRASIRESGIVLVPNEGFGEYRGRVFPVQTDEFWHYLRSQVPQGVNVQLAAEDADYKELALHGDIVRLAKVLVRNTTALLLPELIGRYLKKRLANRFETASLIASVIVDRGKGTNDALQLSYEGPASAFETTLTKAIRRLAAAK
jgi:hypothetical protein